MDEHKQEAKIEIQQNQDDIIRMVKNRIMAMACIANNALSLTDTALKYHLNENIILKDYFGFEAESKEQIDWNNHREQFFNKLEIIRHELVRVMKIVSSSVNKSDLNESPSKAFYNISLSQTVAIVALKFQMPMLFVNKIAKHLSEKSNESHSFLDGNELSEIKIESTLKDQESEVKILPNSYEHIYEELYEFKKKLYSNRDLIKSLNDILVVANLV